MEDQPPHVHVRHFLSLLDDARGNGLRHDPFPIEPVPVVLDLDVHASRLVEGTHHESRPLGLPRAHAILRRFDAVVDGVADHVDQGIPDVLHDGLVELGRFAFELEIHDLPLLAGEIAHQARHLLEGLPDGHHPQRHRQFLDMPEHHRGLGDLLFKREIVHGRDSRIGVDHRLRDDRFADRVDQLVQPLDGNADAVFDARHGFLLLGRSILGRAGSLRRRHGGIGGSRRLDGLELLPGLDAESLSHVDGLDMHVLDEDDSQGSVVAARLLVESFVEKLVRDDAVAHQHPAEGLDRPGEGGHGRRNDLLRMMELVDYFRRNDLGGLDPSAFDVLGIESGDRGAQTVGGDEEDVYVGGRQDELVLAHEIEDGFRRMRQLADARQLEESGQPLDRVEGAERRMQGVLGGRFRLETQKGRLDRPDVLRAFGDEIGEERRILHPRSGGMPRRHVPLRRGKRGRGKRIHDEDGIRHHGRRRHRGVLHDPVLHAEARPVLLGDGHAAALGEFIRMPPEHVDESEQGIRLDRVVGDPRFDVVEQFRPIGEFEHAEFPLEVVQKTLDPREGARIAFLPFQTEDLEFLQSIHLPMQEDLQQSLRLPVGRHAVRIRSERREFDPGRPCLEQLPKSFRQTFAPGRGIGVAVLHLAAKLGETPRLGEERLRERREAEKMEQAFLETRGLAQFASRSEDRKKPVQFGLRQ